MGPISIKAPASCRGGDPNYWHLGDGGIIENTGLDTLEEIVLRNRAAGGSLDRIFLLSVDAGKKTTARSRLEMRNVKMWTDPEGVATVVDAPRVAAREYHDLFWRDMQAALARDGIDYESLVLEYTAPRLDRWPEACDQKPELPGPADFEEIGTGLSISSCHAELLEMGVHQLVHESMNGETGQHLRSLGLTVRPFEH